MLKTVRAFKQQTNGNIAMLFGLIMIPILTAAGIGFDMYRFHNARATIGEAVDAAVLAAARAKIRDPNLSNNDVELLALNVFNANIGTQPSWDLQPLKFEPPSGPSDQEFKISVDGTLKTAILALVGRDTLDLNTESVARAGAPRPLEIALVLDNTQSMRNPTSTGGSKIDALKDAAQQLVDTVMVGGAAGKTRIGVVPFGNHVNVGVSRETAFWLDVPPPETRQNCYVDNDAARANNCREVTQTCNGSDNSTYQCTRWSCPNGDQPPNICEPQVVEWQGCVGSRARPLDIQDADFNASPVPGVTIIDSWQARCPSEVTPLTTQKSTVDNALDNLITRGNTYIPAGLTWGYRLVSPGEPFDEGLSYAEISQEAGKKAVVLMSDGDNTVAPQYPSGVHADGGPSGKIRANQIMAELCDEIKSDDIEVYTIAFEITDNTTINLMRNCATTPGHFYEANGAQQLSGVFGAIAAELIDLALVQ